MRPAMFAAALAALLLPGAAAAQNALMPDSRARAAAADEPCAQADISGGWLITFQKDNQSFACIVRLDDAGKIAGSNCNIGTTETLFRVTGSISLSESCQAIGPLRIKKQGAPLLISTRLSTDRSVMLGVLLRQKDDAFYPVSAIRWPVPE